jgi:hypothetical protein
MMLMPNNEIKDHPRKEEVIPLDLLIDPHPEAVEPSHIHSSD